MPTPSEAWRPACTGAVPLSWDLWPTPLLLLGAGFCPAAANAQSRECGVNAADRDEGKVRGRLTCSFPPRWQWIAASHRRHLLGSSFWWFGFACCESCDLEVSSRQQLSRSKADRQASNLLQQAPLEVVPSCPLLQPSLLSCATAVQIHLDKEPSQISSEPRQPQD